MVFADSKARARRIPWLVSRQYRQVERRGMSCPEYVASAGWLSSCSPPARLWSQLAAQAEPTGVQLPVAFEQGLGLITVDGSL